MKFYLENIDNVISELKSGKEGLSADEATLRLNTDGKNCFEKPKKTPLAIRFLKQIADPMIIILIVAAAVSAFVAFANNESFADVFIILAVVIINAILGIYQESKAEKSIEALQQMSAAKSKVLRDGKRIEILSEDIVVGDVVLLEAGDAVPADGRIIEAASLKIEESPLTGESLAINKLIDALNIKDTEQDVQLADRKNMAYMGTTVVYGRGAMIVTATGMDTEMGKIAGALQNVAKNKTPLQIKMEQLSKVLTWVVVIVCVAVFALQMFKFGIFDGQVVLNSFMIAISLAVAAIPEGLPAVVTVALSIGVSKMSKRNAIIRKLNAVETLGCAQVICSDKTGTLTQNKMTVTDTFCDNPDLLACGMALCNDAKIVDGNADGEPTEVALLEWAIKNNIDLSSYKRCSEIPFDSSRKMMSTLYFDGKYYIQFTKGAPDIVISCCDKTYVNGQISDWSEEAILKVKSKNKDMADKALRVLACAVRYYDKDPGSLDSQNNESNLIFIGLTGMIDPVRPEVKQSIINCKDAGIKTIMITGDHIDTASAIAKELGILNDKMHAVSGADLDKMSDAEFENNFKNISVYARVRPEHKTRIVNAWQKSGYVVAMTGDGVNDAPSIKAADIGVGMGITGTDVTKNVADMVLADDNFASIVNAVEEGRRIYDNILKSIQYLLSSNIGEVVCVFVASLFGFVILLPVHLLLVNMVTDCIPALALSLEDNEPDIMQRKPRKKTAGIFADGVGIDTVYQGLIITSLIFISYLIGVYYDEGAILMIASDVGMTMAFLTTCMVGCFHALNMRSRRLSLFTLKTKNVLLFASILFSIVLLAAICFIEPLCVVFNITSISLGQWLISVGLGFAIIPIVEIVKFFQWIFKKNHKNI